MQITKTTKFGKSVSFSSVDDKDPIWIELAGAPLRSRKRKAYLDQLKKFIGKPGQLVSRFNPETAPGVMVGTVMFDHGKPKNGNHPKVGINIPLSMLTFNGLPNTPKVEPTEEETPVTNAYPEPTNAYIATSAMFDFVNKFKAELTSILDGRHSEISMGMFSNYIPEGNPGRAGWYNPKIKEGCVIKDIRHGRYILMFDNPRAFGQVLIVQYIDNWNDLGESALVDPIANYPTHIYEAVVNRLKLLVDVRDFLTSGEIHRNRTVAFQEGLIPSVIPRPIKSGDEMSREDIIRELQKVPGPTETMKTYDKLSRRELNRGRGMKTTDTTKPRAKKYPTTTGR